MANNNQSTAENSLKLLKEGNRRFFAVRSKVNSEKLLNQRNNTTTEQNPIAIIVSCSDSRVPPEIVFDQGIGSLFVIRVAGNIISTPQIGSIEYAVALLNTPLIVVLGHTSCGAVSATLDSLKNGNSPASPFLEYLINKISPVITQEARKVESSNPNFISELSVDDAVNLNIENSVKQLPKRSLIIREGLRKEELQIVGAYYDLESGLVGWEDEE